MSKNIFTVGDQVVDNCGNKGKITGFQQDKFDKSKLIVEFGTSWREHLEDIEHTKKPIFTTYDGVDIYKGDEYWVVNKRTLYIHRRKSAKDTSLYPEELYFSSHKKAEEYLMKASKMYTKEDIRQAYIKMSGELAGNRLFKMFEEVLDDE